MAINLYDIIYDKGMLNTTTIHCFNGVDCGGHFKYQISMKNAKLCLGQPNDHFCNIERGEAELYSAP
jgi:hypothetical protein